jgi:thioredoxin 1
MSLNSVFVDYCQDEGKCQFWKVDVDQCKEIAQRCGIRSMPTFQIYQKAQKVLCPSTVLLS